MGSNVIVKEAVPVGSVYSLKVNITVKAKSVPKPGQFFMLRATKGKCLMGRPISVYHSVVLQENQNNTKDISLFFIKTLFFFFVPCYS